MKKLFCFICLVIAVSVLFTPMAIAESAQSELSVQYVVDCHEGCFSDYYEGLGTVVVLGSKKEVAVRINLSRPEAVLYSLTRIYFPTDESVDEAVDFLEVRINDTYPTVMAWISDENDPEQKQISYIFEGAGKGVIAPNQEGAYVLRIKNHNTRAVEFRMEYPMDILDEISL